MKRQIYAWWEKTSTNQSWKAEGIRFCYGQCAWTKTNCNICWQEMFSKIFRNGMGWCPVDFKPVFDEFLWGIFIWEFHCYWGNCSDSVLSISGENWAIYRRRQFMTALWSQSKSKLPQRVTGGDTYSWVCFHSRPEKMWAISGCADRYITIWRSGEHHNESGLHIPSTHHLA